MPEYQPGVCNIGKKEVRKRYLIALFGFLISALVVDSVFWFGLPRLAILVAFIPLAVAFEGLYQGYFKFCAGFAAAGVYDVEGSKKKVGSLKDHYKDMGKAKRIHIYSIISAIVITAIVYLVA